MSDKIIDTLQLRRQLKQAFIDLGKTTDELELLAQAEQIARHYDPGPVINELLNHLDTPSSQLRGGLGRLATLLPQEQVLPALRNTAANRNNSAQTRLTAALILERFLDVPIASALLSDLDDSQQVAMQSLQDAVVEGRQNRYVLLEYVMQMREESEDVAFMVMDLLDQLPAQDRPELLRLIAQDARVAVVEAALERLATQRSDEAGPQAARALHSLQFNLPPDLARRARRNLRKLQLQGVRHELPRADNWRALLSPADPDGDQALWFMHLGADDESGILVGLRINWKTGILEAFGSESIDRGHLPEPRPVGQLVSMTVGQEPAVVLLEVPFDYGRWQLQLALAAHRQAAEPLPLPDDYHLYNDLIWQFVPPQVEDEWQTFLASGPTLWRNFLAGSERETLNAIALDLLRHPAMASWFFYNQPMLRLVDQTLAQAAFATAPEILQALLEDIVRMAGQPVLSGLTAGLQAQAGWFYIARHHKKAAQALLLAESLRYLPSEEHPLLIRMAEIGLFYATTNRLSGQTIA